MAVRRTLSARELNRATLARQLLLERAAVTVPEAVRRVVAVQAQEPAAPYVALWNRVADFDAAELDAALASHEVVKASLMRITLHVVDVDDYPAFHAAMQPTLRAARYNDRRFTETGLTAEDADAHAATVLGAAAEPRPSAELERLHDEPRMWWALRHVGPFWHAPSAGATWGFGQRNHFLAARTRVLAAAERDDAARYLIRRYLEGFGPASIADISQFVLFPNSKTRTRELVASMSDELVPFEDPDGTELLDVPGAPIPDADTPAPARLMAMWDSTLLAYADRSRVIPDAYRPLVTRRNGDVLPTLLVDGHVVGVWRPLDGGIEATAFETIDEAGVGGPRRRGTDARGVPRRSRPERLQPRAPLVGQGPPRRRRPRPPRLSPTSPRRFPSYPTASVTSQPLDVTDGARHGRKPSHATVSVRSTSNVAAPPARIELALDGV